MEISNYLRIKNSLPNHVNLLAVSKGFKASEIEFLHSSGQNHFGESKYQEAKNKQILLEKYKKIKWHFIGRLQSNKIRKVVNNFEYIHSVDSYEKLVKISNVAEEIHKKPSLMIQVKLAYDSEKGGIGIDQLIDQWNDIKKIKNVEIKGLMTINPNGLSSIENFRLFEQLRNMANSLNLEDCSMGMSNDWKEALEAGATWLRLGSIIFGERNIL